MNIASTGTVVAFGGPLKRAGPIGVGPNDTVTATGTAAQFATLSTGDTVLIMTSSTVIFPTGGTASSAPFYGAFTINKTSPTTFHLLDNQCRCGRHACDFGPAAGTLSSKAARPSRRRRYTRPTSTAWRTTRL
jgi:hypothetical protein